MTEVSLFCFVILAIYLVLSYKKPATAFTTVPITTCFLVYFVTVTDTVENLLFAPIVFVGTLVVVAASGWNRRSREWYHWGAWYLLLGIVATLVMGVVLAGLGALGAGYVVAVILLASVLVFFASLIHYGVLSRRTTAINVFSTIGAGMRQNLPLPMALDCAATGADSGTAAVLRGIKTWLVKGCSLADAIRRGYPQSPPRTLAMVAAGEQIGQLPAALAAIETDVRSQAIGPRRLRPVHPFYPVVVVAIVLFLTTGILTFIMPQFQAVLHEMVEGELPLATRILMEIMDWLVRDSYGLLVLFLAALAILVYSRYRARRRSDRPSFFLWLGDFVTWHLPLVHGFERDRSMVQVLELLRMSLTAGRPVNEAIRATLKLDTNASFRRRLGCWLERVERGESIGESARRCGLGTAPAWAFDNGVNVDNTPAVLELLESYYRSRYSYRLNLTRYILWPVGIVLLGLMVGFVAYAIFSPGVAVINQMGLSVYP